MKHITATIAALLLTVAIATSALAQSQPTRLGLWAQAQGRTAAGAAIGCNIRPPHSTYCWRHIVDASGNIVAIRHYVQMANGRISTYTTAYTGH
jgi:hypothetical protein